ncbi:MAG: leucine-rich repeat domain-containing protein [Clostridia bacterium]|nr:leucine-rich repeat domain-containing protein [Clostridia bacterium]
MKYCLQCGAECPDNIKKCESCGNGAFASTREEYLAGKFGKAAQPTLAAQAPHACESYDEDLFDIVGTYLVLYKGDEKKVAVPTFVTEIDEDAFGDTSEMEELILPDGVKVLPECIFAYSVNLKTVRFPSELERIEESAFQECTSLISVNIESVDEIGEFAFSECKGLESVKIASGLKKIGEYAFDDCENLKTVILPDGLEEIGEHAFDGCTDLKEIRLPDSVKKIGPSAFEKCVSLEKIVIPKSVTLIDYDTFYECKNLKTVVIHDGVKEIAASAFEDCDSLTEKPCVTQADTDFKMDGTTLEDYTGTARDVTIPSYADKIGDFAFEGYDIKTVTVRQGGSYDFPEGCFANCKSLEKLYLPNTIWSFGEKCFENCLSLVEFECPARLIFIYDWAFAGCKNLKSITLSEDLAQIKDEAFKDCASLESITIPENVSKMGANIFLGCENITVYCEAKQKPSGWNNNWDVYRTGLFKKRVKVVWGVEKKSDDDED